MYVDQQVTSSEDLSRGWNNRMNKRRHTESGRDREKALRVAAAAALTIISHIAWRWKKNLLLSSLYRISVGVAWFCSRDCSTHKNRLSVRTRNKPTTCSHTHAHSHTSKQSQQTHTKRSNKWKKKTKIRNRFENEKWRVPEGDRIKQNHIHT